MTPPPPRRFLWENRVFLGACAAFFLAGIPWLLLTETGDLVLFFSDRRSLAGDWFFRLATRLGEAAAFILAFAGLLFVRLRSALFVPLLAIIVTLVSFGGKSFFAHPRPYPYLEAQGQLGRLQPVEGVKVHKGNTSFPSGHTMAAFALFGFLAFSLPRKKGAGLLFFAMALAAGLSRIYLVQHFFKDVYLGAWLGVGIAVLIYYGHFRYPAFPDRRLDRPLLISKGTKLM